MDWIAFICIVFIIWLVSYLRDQIKEKKRRKQTEGIKKHSLDVEKWVGQALEQSRVQQQVETSGLRKRQEHGKRISKKKVREKVVKSTGVRRPGGKCRLEAYLDIETTSFSKYYGEITVVGILICDGINKNVVQLVGKDITRDNLLKTLDGVDIIYTYNGSKFDLPFIEDSLGIDLANHCRHHDLMLDCWEKNLYGGFKKVEEKLGIERRLKGIDGRSAIKLWERYKNYQDQTALNTLLEYNREDVVNLKILKEKLTR